MESFKTAIAARQSLINCANAGKSGGTWLPRRTTWSPKLGFKSHLRHQVVVLLYHYVYIHVAQNVWINFYLCFRGIAIIFFVCLFVCMFVCLHVWMYVLMNTRMDVCIYALYGCIYFDSFWFRARNWPRLCKTSLAAQRPIISFGRTSFRKRTWPDLSRLPSP